MQNTSRCRFAFSQQAYSISAKDCTKMFSSQKTIATWIGLKFLLVTSAICLHVASKLVSAFLIFVKMAFQSTKLECLNVPIHSRRSLELTTFLIDMRMNETVSIKQVLVASITFLFAYNLWAYIFSKLDISTRSDVI